MKSWLLFNILCLLMKVTMYAGWGALLCLCLYFSLTKLLIWMISLWTGQSTAEGGLVQCEPLLCFSCGFCSPVSRLPAILVIISLWLHQPDFCCLISQGKLLGYFKCVIFKYCDLRKQNFLNINRPIRFWMVFLRKNSAWNGKDGWNIF